LISKTIWEKQLNDIFKEKDKTELDIILSMIPLVLGLNYNEDQVDLFNLLGLDEYVKFSKFFDGKTIHSIRESEIKECLQFILLYYYKEIKGRTWKQIKKELPSLMRANSISYALRIKKINNSIKTEVDNLFNQIDKIDVNIIENKESKNGK
jgi:hypothetical protein